MLVRAYAAPDEGRCDLYIDDSLAAAGAAFAGTTLPVEAGRKLHAVLLDDGDGDEPWPPTGRAARDPLLGFLDPRRLAFTPSASTDSQLAPQAT